MVTNLPPAGSSIKVSIAAVDLGFAEFAPIKGSNTVTIVSVAKHAPDFAVEEAETKNIYRYVTAEDMIFPMKDEQTNVKLTKISGTLPAGLSAKYDVEKNAMVISGKPTAKSGTYSVVYRAKVANTLGMPKIINFVIVDPTDYEKSPAIANRAVGKSRTYSDVPVISGDLMVGTLQVTIPTKGNVSARFTGANGTVSLSAKNWTGFDASTRALSTMLSGRKNWSMTFTADNDYGIYGEIYEGDEFVGAFDYSGAMWKDEPATDWAGYYTVAFGDAKQVGERSEYAPTGYGYLTLKLSGTSALKQGKVTWAGILPNGTAISGSSVMGRTADEEIAALPVFKRSSTDVFSALMEIEANAITNANRKCIVGSSAVKPTWSHFEKNAEYEIEYQVYGAYFNPNKEDLQCCCNTCYSGGGTDPVELELNIDGVSVGQVQVSSNKIEVVNLKKEATNATVSYKPATGLVSGTFKNDEGKTLSYKGILLLGWGGITCDCGDASDSYKPFMCGSYFEKVNGVKIGGKIDIDHLPE